MLDGSKPEYWLLVTLLFAILANVNPSPVPVYLGGTTAVVGFGLYVYELSSNVLGREADAA